MPSSRAFNAIFLSSVICGLLPNTSPLSVTAFQVQPCSVKLPSGRALGTELSVTKSNDDIDSSSISRRNMLQTAGCALSALVGGTMMGQPAEATYSAYSRREEDWKQREANGDIKFSNARDLRNQLRDIAPMNSEGSKIFCPNGPSAAVSPLMENKCGDRLALPSVYGRRDDVMGNSVPGFGGSNVVGLRAELESQAYFRD